MRAVSKSPRLMLLLAMLAGPAAGSVAAQPQDASENGVMTTVYGSPAPEEAEMTEGPEIEGTISARRDDRLQVTAADDTHTLIADDENTRIKASRSDEPTSELQQPMRSTNVVVLSTTKNKA